MMEINTIQEYFALTREQQNDICRNIQTISRLKSYLETLNNKIESLGSPEWVPCKKCHQKGWVLDKEEVRNNADIHASQIHKCIKALWYACAGYQDYGKTKVSAELRLVFDHGHALHHMLQRYGSKGAWGNPNYYKAEVPIIPDAEEALSRNARILEEAIKYKIRSSVDAEVENYIVPGVRGLGEVSIRLLHEYKSIHPGRIKKGGGLYGGFTDLRQPKIEHRQQATIYMKCLNVPLTVFIYYNKGDDTMAEFNMPFDPILWSNVKNKIVKVLAYADIEEMPPWEETSALLDSDECKNCDYLSLCNPPTRIELK